MSVDKLSQVHESFYSCRELRDLLYLDIHIMVLAIQLGRVKWTIGSDQSSFYWYVPNHRSFRTSLNRHWAHVINSLAKHTTRNQHQWTDKHHLWALKTFKFVLRPPRPLQSSVNWFRISIDAIVGPPNYKYRMKHSRSLTL